MKSPEFASLWSKHPVANCVSGTKHFRHPEIGEITLEFEALLLADKPDQRILMYSAEPYSPSEAALQLLRRTVESSHIEDLPRGRSSADRIG
jgi:hypothetical protein